MIVKPNNEKEIKNWVHSGNWNVPFCRAYALYSNNHKISRPRCSFAVAEIFNLHRNSKLLRTMTSLSNHPFAQTVVSLITFEVGARAKLKGENQKEAKAKTVNQGGECGYREIRDWQVFFCLLLHVCGACA